ncbi:hypothetical protein H0E87_001831 [Populus deltoides]|uniref:Rad21/Rec8-like protein N-terminal domain-containing protein n=1 Tax=Populus deltoides TaxID=3696 RepID=A0A8T2ZT27_POPDE|nr:hypothetical protein H0E87_001831 [Populus deltoides]
MFYSQTFLARKGPLGTVWCAAHLQHRLKKSHYTSTDIPSTVDRIMFPEVPIALRMSSHLLLGVVRIYKKKVDYLFQDCTVALAGLNKAFTTTEVNLPENATTATFESITLPPTLNLDGFDMSDYLDPEGSPDNHLKSYEEITITDQISPYITIHVDEDNICPSVPEQDPSSEARPVDDIHPPPPVNGDLPSQDTGQRTQTVVNNETGPGASNQTDVLVDDMDFHDPGQSNQPEDPMDTEDFRDPAPSNQTEVLMHTGDFQDPGPSNQTSVPTETLNQSLNGENSPPEIEVMRDAATDLGSESFPPLSPTRRDDAAEPNRSLDEVLNEKDFLSPIMEDALPSLEKSLPFQQHSKAPTSAASQDIPDVFDTHGSFGNISPQFAIRSTPPVQQPQPGPPPAQQPRPRRRRRMQFDEATVLTNRFMRRALEDPSDLMRKKRTRSSSMVGIWRLNNSLRKEQIFYEPLITGSCEDLCKLSEKDYITTKPHLTLEQGDISEHGVTTSPGPETEAIPEPRMASSPAPTAEPISEPMIAQSPVPGRQSGMEKERPQQDLGCYDHSVLPEIDMEIERLRNDGGHDGNDFLSDLPSPAMSMPSPGRFMPSSLRRDDFTPMPISSFGSGTVPQEGTSTTVHTPEFSASPGTYQLGEQNTGLSDIPELMKTAEDDDLAKILEADNTPVGTLGTRDIDSLSVRTRGVAKYLKEHSPIIPLSEESSGDISLTSILQGKTRKLCARMFFETMLHNM